VLKKQLATRPQLARGSLRQQSNAADGLWATKLDLGTLSRKFLIGAEDLEKIENNTH
jgi:hypothetical protein